MPRRCCLGGCGSAPCFGTGEPLTDLYIDVDPQRDHVRGPLAAPVTLVEYGDFECPYCGQAEPVVRELLRDFGDVRYVWRHLPLTDVHPAPGWPRKPPRPQPTRERSGRCTISSSTTRTGWGSATSSGYAEQLGLDVERFTNQLQDRAGATRVADDVDSADLSGVSGTPTFFINGRRHYGAFTTIGTLTDAVRTARLARNGRCGLSGLCAACRPQRRVVSERLQRRSAFVGSTAYAATPTPVLSASAASMTGASLQSWK